MPIHPVSTFIALLVVSAPAFCQDSDTQVKGPPRPTQAGSGEDMQLPGKPGDTTSQGNIRGVGYDNRGGMMDASSLEGQALDGGGNPSRYGGGADGYGTASYVIPPQNTGTYRGNYGMARGYYGGGYRGGTTYYGSAGSGYNRGYTMNNNAQFRAADARNGVFNPYAMGGSGRTYWSD